jgi:lysozyme
VQTGIPMLMALDFEPSATTQMTENDAAVFLSTVKATVGSWPVLYTRRWDVAPAQPNFQQCALWLAEYGASPVCPPGWSEWKSWQHTDGQSGSGVVPVPGIGRCDRNRFADAVSQLGQWWRNPTP